MRSVGETPWGNCSGAEPFGENSGQPDEPEPHGELYAAVEYPPGYDNEDGQQEDVRRAVGFRRGAGGPGRSQQERRRKMHCNACHRAACCGSNVWNAIVRKSLSHAGRLRHGAPRGRHSSIPNLSLAPVVNL